jgi:F-type H+-transporting ATPase subunit h
LIQELYLKELKAYKPPAIKANDSEGQVHKFAVPATPKSPEETDLQSGLAEYESQTPDVVGSSADGEAAPAEQDIFEEDEEEEGGAHH